MLLTNLDTIPNKELEILGLVSGVGIPPIKISFSTKAWGGIIEEGVERATESMVEKARKMGADAIVKVFYDKECSESWVHIMGWGTAVRYK